MLESMAFPPSMDRVAEIAGGHHETLDGRGYPRGLTAEQLSIPARILAIADIFEALTATDKLRSEFITSVTAELEGPARSIAQLAEKLRGTPEALTAAHDILEAAEALKMLITDVRDLSGVEAGHQVLSLDSFDVCDLVTRVTAMTKEAVRRRGVALTVNCPDNTGWMVGDAVRCSDIYNIGGRNIEAYWPGLRPYASRAGRPLAYSLQASASHGVAISRLGSHPYRRDQRCRPSAQTK
jgi:signal transduction histidine kinase